MASLFVGQPGLSKTVLKTATNVIFMIHAHNIYSMTGHGIVLKSESHIRQEIDAKCAQDDQECAAIFDDLEDLMNQRGGEWDFKKNHDVQRCSSPSPSQRFGSG